MGKPLDLETAKESFFRELTLRDYAARTRKTYRDNLKHFENFCVRAEKTDLRSLTEEDIRQYRTEILAKPWVQFTKDKLLIQLKIFFRYLTKEQLIFSDPTENLQVKTKRQKNLSPVLSRLEMEKLILSANREQQPGEHRWLGLRHGAMLELLYSCGLRLGEIICLKVDEVDLKNGVVFIHNGKGRKDRVVPIGKRAVAAIQKYLQELRPKLAARVFDKSLHYPFSQRQRPQGLSSHLFLSSWGGKLEESVLKFVMKSHVKMAGITKRVHVHLIRHTMATHLLQNGAPIQVVGAMLGHARLETSQIYTRVVLNDLKKAWHKYHPRGKFLWISQKEQNPQGRCPQGRCPEGQYPH